jgi:hypothetical protein
MSNASKALRGLVVLVTIAIMIFLIWRFTAGLYLIPSIIIAVLITLGTAWLVFRSPGAGGARSKGMKINDNSLSIPGGKPITEPSSGMSGTVDSDSHGIALEPEAIDVSPRGRRRLDSPDTPLRSIKPVEKKPEGAEVAARYIKMSQISTQSQPKIADSLISQVEAETPLAPENNISPQPEDGESPLPLIEDQSSLTEDENNELVNAVWCRCENPYCKYTRFLSVHHLVEEKDGGTNRLDNLVVLCPYCHDLAHRNEIPEIEMREWISNREERFKFKPDWQHI